MDISEQFQLLAPFEILPLSLRLCFRFNTFLFGLCKWNEQSSILKYINTQRNEKNHLIHPICYTDLLKFSFSTISIKHLNLYLSDNIFLSKSTFIFFLKREILDVYIKTLNFFT